MGPERPIGVDVMLGLDVGINAVDERLGVEYCVGDGLDIGASMLRGNEGDRRTGLWELTCIWWGGPSVECFVGDMGDVGGLEVIRDDGMIGTGGGQSGAVASMGELPGLG